MSLTHDMRIQSHRCPYNTAQTVYRGGYKNIHGVGGGVGRGEGRSWKGSVEELEGVKGEVGRGVGRS